GPDLADWRAGAKSFEVLGGYHPTNLTLTGLGAAERVDAAAIDSGIFAALRIAPERGRTFDPADDAPGAARVVLVSHAFWKARLGGSDAALGTSLVLDGKPFTIVGVMPATFRFPLDGPEAAIWVQPWPAPFGNMLDQRALFFYQVVGRLRPGASLDEGRAELQTITSAISAAHPDSHAQRGVLVAPL